MKRPLLFSLSALALVIFLWACASETPKQVAEKFLSAMAVGDFEAAKKWASKESHAALDLMAGADVEMEAKRIEIGEEMVSENKATVAYKENGNEKVLRLVKEDGKWKAAWSKSDMEEGPAEIGEHFLEAMAVGDIENAKQYATREAQSSLDMMAATAEAKRANPDRIVIGRVKVEGNKAVLNYTENGVDKTLNLVREDGKWKAAWTKGGGDVDRDMR